MRDALRGSSIPCSCRPNPWPASGGDVQHRLNMKGTFPNLFSSQTFSALLQSPCQFTKSMHDTCPLYTSVHVLYTSVHVLDTLVHILYTSIHVLYTYLHVHVFVHVHARFVHVLHTYVHVLHTYVHVLHMYVHVFVKSERSKDWQDTQQGRN